MPTRKVVPRAKTKVKGAPRRRAHGWQLVWVDQGPLRDQAASECGRAMARLEKARGQWKRFERDDQPAFRRWCAATFGVLLSRLREVESLVREKEALVRQVEEEMYFGGTPSYRAAYARVQKRRANPAPEPESHDHGAPPPRSKKGGPSVDEELSEFEQELLFEEFVATILGLNPDRMSDGQYASMFADFKAKVLGQAPPEPPEEPEPKPPLTPEPVKPEQNRIKELYRLLVRRLHPDTRADSNAEVSALWHEVQEAYGAGNVDRLEMLLAFTDIQSNTSGEHTSLFQMHSVLAELRRAFNALQRNLRAAKKDHAWNFARLADHTKVETRVRREIESTLTWNEDQLRQLEALIARWSTPPKRNGGSRRPKATRSEFSF